ncbi:MAG: hypothetical protein HYX41_01105 [Bdellovibrio sp.]|nr:hypothetical protein [Bdellovibrio sp.]
MRLTSRLLVFFWILGFIAAFTIQSLFQHWFAEVTLWGSAPGWQTEIAIWNLGVICVLVPLVRVEDLSKKAIPGLIVLSLLFGVNHLYAAVQSSQFFLGNWLGALSNFGAAGLGLGSVLFRNPR